jgi:hypothetical protein
MQDMAFVLASGLFFAFLAVGYWARRWSFVAATIGLCSAIGIALWINDGWFGAGWGEFGVTCNVIAATLVILAVALGVAAGQAAGRAR